LVWKLNPETLKGKNGILEGPREMWGFKDKLSTKDKIY
jgi:hypothetical protein